MQKSEKIESYWTISEKTKNGKAIYRCICGTEKEIHISNVNSGKSKSCGCQRSKLLLQTTGTHGKTNTLLYGVWLAMRRRCYNKNTSDYKNYGGRDIKVCNEWKERFENFYEWASKNDYKNGLTLERIENNKNYDPTNCCWVDRFTQGRNKRNNHYLTIHGETKTLSEWSSITGIHHETLRGRIRRGWRNNELLIPPKLGRNQHSKKRVEA